MNRMLIGVVVGLALLSGCALTPNQQEALERGSGPAGGVSYPVGRSVGLDGVACRYADGTVIRRQNVAERCF